MALQRSSLPPSRTTACSRGSRPKTQAGWPSLLPVLGIGLGWDKIVGVSTRTFAAFERDEGDGEEDSLQELVQRLDRLHVHVRDRVARHLHRTLGL